MCVLPWNNIGSAFMQAQYGYSAEKGNFYLMLPYIISAFCVPFFGYICDRIGRRAELLVLSTMALSVTHFLFGWIPSVNPLVALCLMGVSYSIYASAIWPAIALVVKPSKLGTAYGFITAVQNGGLALFPIIVGQLTRNHNDPTKEYYYVELFFLGLGVFGVLIGFLVLFLDCNRGSRLAKPSIQKKDKKKQDKEYVAINKKIAILDPHDVNDTNISLQTPELMYEQHQKGNLQRTPVVMGKTEINEETQA